jgi:nitrite reductase/ring-hydroxylating ferredoxin subunit
VLAATYLDATGGQEERVAARRLVGWGNMAAVPTALAGVSDWVDTLGAERRVGLVHSVLNATALGLYGGSWIARRRGRHAAGTVLSFAGGGVLAGAGWLGAHLSYALGVGVDTPAFQRLPQRWTDVGPVSDVVTGQATCVAAGGVPVMLVRHEDGIVAMADRCTHRGGSLHEGEIADGCVTGPLHGSRLRLTDGAVGGPAVRPAPMLEVRLADGRVQVRRGEEPRSLRSNPVGI